MSCMSELIQPWFWILLGLKHLVLIPWVLVWRVCWERRDQAVLCWWCCWKGHFQPGVKRVPLESLYLQVSLPWKDWKVCHNSRRIEGGCRSWRVLFLGLLENSLLLEGIWLRIPDPFGFVQKWKGSFQRSRGLFWDRCCRTGGLFSGKGWAVWDAVPEGGLRGIAERNGSTLAWNYSRANITCSELSCLSLSCSQQPDWVIKSSLCRLCAVPGSQCSVPRWGCQNSSGRISLKSWCSGTSQKHMCLKWLSIWASHSSLYKKLQQFN